MKVIYIIRPSSGEVFDTINQNVMLLFQLSRELLTWIGLNQSFNSPNINCRFFLILFYCCFLVACSVDQGFAAIKDVHAHIDDDHDGIIDRSESEDVCTVLNLFSLLYCLE